MGTLSTFRGGFRAIVLAIAVCLSFAAACAADSRKTLRLTFLGDLMAHPALFAAADYRDIYSGVADVLAGSDFVFANLEFPVNSTRPVSGYPLFNAHLDYVSAAVEAGIDVFSAANNHAFDGGEEGVLQSVRALTLLADKSPGRLFFSGIRGNQRRPFMPETLTVNGVRIGFIAVTQFLNQPGGSRYVHVVDYDDPEEAAEFAALVKEVSPFFDLFIVSYHGDREYVQEPDPVKRTFFRTLVENGATIVFGHHPHVLQEYELVTVRGSTRLIMYSMGNFISGMAWRQSPPDPDGVGALISDSIMLRVDVATGTGGASVVSTEPIPIADYQNQKGELVVSKMDDLADGKAGVSPVWASYFLARRARIWKLLGAAGKPLRSEVQTPGRPR